MCFSADSDRISSENAGRQPNAITEGIGEGRDILISHALCDALDRQVGRLEQVLSAVEAHQDDVFMRGIAAFPLEQAGKMVLAHVDALRDILQGDRFAVMFPDKVDGRPDGGIRAVLRIRRRAVVQQRRQHAAQLMRQADLPGQLVVPAGKDQLIDPVLDLPGVDRIKDKSFFCCTICS